MFIKSVNGVMFLLSSNNPFTLHVSPSQSNKVPVVQHAHMHPLTPLITYSNEHFSPGTPPSHLSPEILDPKTGITHTHTLFRRFCWLVVYSSVIWLYDCVSRYSTDPSPRRAVPLLPPVPWRHGTDPSSFGVARSTVSFSNLIMLLHAQLCSFINIQILVRTRGITIERYRQQRET